MSEQERYDAIKLDDLEQKLFDCHTTFHQSSEYVDPPLYLPMFKVGCQSFFVSREPYEDKLHAMWVRKMVAKALAKLVRELPDTIETTKPRG